LFNNATPVSIASWSAQTRSAARTPHSSFPQQHNEPWCSTTNPYYDGANLCRPNNAGLSPPKNSTPNSPASAARSSAPPSRSTRRSASIYKKALIEELKNIDASYECDHTFPINYKDVTVGELSFDFYINNRFALQVLAEHREIDGLDRTSLRASLRAADLELGLIINFGERRLKDGLVRVLNPDKLNAMRDNAPANDNENHHASDPE
jgi:GxxExxY protein